MTGYQVKKARHTCIPAASGSRLSCNSTEFPGRRGPKLWKWQHN